MTVSPCETPVRAILDLNMPVLVSLLRGVNVGGHHLIKMETLRELYQSLDLEEPQSLLQSGNVVFRSAQRNRIALGEKIEAAIEEKFGFRPVVITRDTAELREVIAGNPFAAREHLDPAKLAVLFLARDPAPASLARLETIQTEPEELQMRGRELYIYYPNGMGRTKLTAAVIEKALGVPGTARNWNTVTKLLELAGTMEARPAMSKRRTGPAT